MNLFSNGKTYASVILNDGDGNYVMAATAMTDGSTLKYLLTGFDGVAFMQILYSSTELVGTSNPVARRTSSDLTASGATVTAPAGYYPTAATKTIDSGTEGIPIATKGTVSNH